MSATQLRILYAVLTALAAGLSFFLAGAADAGVSAMARLILGALLAAIVAILGIPTIFQRSTLDPGKSEKDVVMAARRGDMPRGMA